MTQKLDRRTRYTLFCYQCNLFLELSSKKLFPFRKSQSRLSAKGGNYTGYVLLALYGYLCLVRRYP